MLSLYYLFGLSPLHQRGVTACSSGWFPKPLLKSHAESAVRTLLVMTHNFGKPVALAGLLDQRYTVRYPFSVTAEILELETGTRLGGVTSDLSFRGWFVRSTRLLEARSPVRLTFAR